MSPVADSSYMTHAYQQIQSVTPPHTSFTNFSQQLMTLDTQYDIFISYAVNDASLYRDRLLGLTQFLRQQGYHCYLPEPDSHHDSKERRLEALDRSKCMILCVTEEYHNRVNLMNTNTVEGGGNSQDWCRWELNYALGAMTLNKIIPVIFEATLSKKTHWKHRFRSDLYSSKPIPFFDEASLSSRCEDISVRVKATTK